MKRYMITNLTPSWNSNSFHLKS